MAGKKIKTFNLGLRGKKIKELRNIASRYLQKSPEEISTSNKYSLIAGLSRAASGNAKLTRELKKAKVAIKPSFYIMILTLKEDRKLSIKSAKIQLKRVLNKLNTALKRQSKFPSCKNFYLEEVLEYNKNIVEDHFTWHRVYWYWDPDTVSLAPLYELRFGFAILDFDDRKAIITCQTRHERDLLVKVLCEVYPIDLFPLILTRPVLYQIGSFDQLKRAGYFIPNPDPNTPSNIIYADNQLAAIPIARALEENPRSQRKRSFYRIPLGPMIEQGVGATSDSGKLWIPREIPLDTVREYGIELLSKIGRTLDSMTRRGEFDQVLASLGPSNFPKIAAIKNVALRNGVIALLSHLVNMLIKKETERFFMVPLSFVTEGVPSLFSYPRLQLEEPTTGDIAFWCNSDRTSQMVKVTSKGEAVTLTGYPLKEVVNLSQVPHPETGAFIKVEDPLPCLHFVPTAKLHEALLEGIQYISNQVHKLRKVVCLPFWISANVLNLDVERAFGRADMKTLGTVLLPTDLKELRQPLRQSILASDESRVRKTLIELGEMCVHMSDSNCRSCVRKTDYLCLRSLVARYLEASLLLAHKGIELSDMQGKATVDDEEAIIFGFAKLAQGKGSLTARNNNGAVLQAQVLGQVRKTTFNTVLIISPSTINEDLREHLRAISGVFGKKLIILDQEALAKLLLYFEEQASFDGLDVKQIYKASKQKNKKPKKKEVGTRRVVKRQRKHISKQ